MNKFFVPYYGKKPAAIEINGHRLIMLSESDEIDQQELELVGADRLKTVRVEEDTEDTARFFAKLSLKTEAGVVIVPKELRYSDILSSLQNNLPWLQ